MPQTVIALDIGHSAVKALATSVDGETHRFFVPSVVCPAISISDEAEAARAKLETVTIAPGPSGTYFFGQTAVVQGAGTVTGLSENWVMTKEHAALMMGVMQRIRQAVRYTDQPEIILGLPTSLCESQRGELEAQVRKNLPDVGSVKIIPQSMGPYYGIMLDERGYPSREHGTDESWGVIEVGYFSTDFMLSQTGQWKQSGSGICRGVSEAAEHVKRVMSEKGITMTLSEAETVLQTKTVKSFGQRIDASDVVNEAVGVLVTQVLDAANQKMESCARLLDGVLVAGGGAPLVFEHIKKQWPHAILVDDHRFAVAEGMRRLGLARVIRREASEKKG